MGRVSMEELADNYLAAVRATHTAVRKHSAHARVYLSLEHHWNIHYPGGDAQQTFAGRPFIDYFAKRAKESERFRLARRFPSIPRRSFQLPHLERQIRHTLRRYAADHVQKHRTTHEIFRSSRTALQRPTPPHHSFRTRLPFTRHRGRPASSSRRVRLRLPKNSQPRCDRFIHPPSSCRSRPGRRSEPRPLDPPETRPSSLRTRREKENLRSFQSVRYSRLGIRLRLCSADYRHQKLVGYSGSTVASVAPAVPFFARCSAKNVRKRFLHSSSRTPIVIALR